MLATTMRITVDDARTDIEKAMMFLDPERTEIEHRMYLAGYIDRMFANGEIDEETLNILYVEYAF